MLVDWDGFSSADASRLLSMNQSTARTRHGRALRRLQRHLEGGVRTAISRPAKPSTIVPNHRHPPAVRCGRDRPSPHEGAHHPRCRGLGLAAEGQPLPDTPEGGCHRCALRKPLRPTGLCCHRDRLAAGSSESAGGFGHTARTMRMVSSRLTPALAAVVARARARSMTSAGVVLASGCTRVPAPTRVCSSPAASSWR